MVSAIVLVQLLCEPTDSFKLARKLLRRQLFAALVPPDLVAAHPLFVDAGAAAGRVRGHCQARERPCAAARFRPQSRQHARDTVPSVTATHAMSLDLASRSLHGASTIIVNRCDADRLREIHPV